MKQSKGKRQKRCYKKGRNKNRKRSTSELVVEKSENDAGDTR